jgi:hypothetical protein
MKQYLALLFLLFALKGTAQNREKLIGDWKFYLQDRISFEFLRLNDNGTGVKCLGQTLNGKDTLFLDHITTLLITNWEVKKQKLTIESRNNLSFKVNPDYKLTLLDDDKIKLEGEHLIY